MKIGTAIIQPVSFHRIQRNRENINLNSNPCPSSSTNIKYYSIPIHQLCPSLESQVLPREFEIGDDNSHLFPSLDQSKLSSTLKREF